MLSRVGAAAVLAVAALLIALPRASADGGHADVTPPLDRLLYSPERLSSRHFAQLFGVPKA